MGLLEQKPTTDYAIYIVCIFMRREVFHKLSLAGSTLPSQKFQMINSRNYTVFAFYILAAIFFYPIIAHILMYKLGYFTDNLPHGKGWLFIQIFLSSPALIFLGTKLYLKYGYQVINKILGVFLILIGLYWLYMLISDIAEEAG